MTFSHKPLNTHYWCVKTTLSMLIKVVLKKRYVRVEQAENGRYIPVVEGPYELGSYYLRYTLNGKRKWESVGGDLNIALQEQKARQASIELVPSATAATLPTRKTVAEAIKKFIANKNGEDHHAQRRARSWKWLLDLFFNWWDTRPTLTNLLVQIFRRSRNTRRRRASSLALNTTTSQPHDFFNLFNHANFGFPDNWSSDAGFGQIFYQEQAPTSILGSGLSANVSPRMIQLRVQLQF
jgi:hypothetical protein